MRRPAGHAPAPATIRQRKPAPKVSSSIFLIEFFEGEVFGPHIEISFAAPGCHSPCAAPVGWPAARRWAGPGAARRGPVSGGPGRVRGRRRRLAAALPCLFALPWVLCSLPWVLCLCLPPRLPSVRALPSGGHPGPRPSMRIIGYGHRSPPEGAWRGWVSLFGSTPSGSGAGFAGLPGNRAPLFRGQVFRSGHTANSAGLPTDLRYLLWCQVARTGFAAQPAQTDSRRVLFLCHKDILA